jgi:hypothetical protein
MSVLSSKQGVGWWAGLEVGVLYGPNDRSKNAVKSAPAEGNRSKVAGTVIVEPLVGSCAGLRRALNASPPVSVV